MPGCLWKPQMMEDNLPRISGGHHLKTSFAETGLELREYYSAACGHCQAMAPAWKEAAASYSGPVAFRQVECNDKDWKPVEENIDLCKDIEAFPSIKLFKDGEEVTSYEGDRTAEGFMNFAKANEKLAEQSMPVVMAVLPRSERILRRCAEFL
ncbi:Protein disulfide-isomerase A3 (58 kDa glucose-regulated protein) (58 kDa microsomal protein) (p58) (Disulfide isomerase ER-60) (Endoplasmic reticulum resident protein 57) (ER protein 57) (ERp57) (Endoplasmic reticulum resident protein 60) (ER protein 60) (ERp60) [Durusdinium trenchii]